MKLRLLSAAQQLEQIDSLIKFLREYGFASTERLDALKTVAADLRGRLPKAPVEAVAQIENRLAAIKRAGADCDLGSKVGLADDIIGRWPTIRQALEFYGHHVSRPQGNADV